MNISMLLPFYINNRPGEFSQKQSRVSANSTDKTPEARVDWPTSFVAELRHVSYQYR